MCVLRVVGNADWPTGPSTHFEVVWDEELGRPEEVEDVAEHVSIPVNEVVLLQAVQHYGLRAIEETADSAHREGEGESRRDGGSERERGREWEREGESGRERE